MWTGATTDVGHPPARRHDGAVSHVVDDGADMPGPIDPVAFATLVNLQCGVVSRGQCLNHGITSDAALRRLRAGAWQMPYRGAFVTHAGPIEPDTNTWAALLAVGAPCVASHETAVWLGAPERLRAPAKVHVGVLDGRRVNPLEGVVVHHLADLCGERVLWNAAPPRIRAEQATLDVVHLCRTDDAIVAAIAASVTARVTTISRLREQLSHRPRMRNRALVVDILADVEEGAESAL